MAWERLVHQELSSGNATIDTGTFTGKKNLRVIIHTLSASYDHYPYIRFNGDSGANYSYQKNSNGEVPDGSANVNLVYHDIYVSNNNSYVVMDIMNIAGQEKLTIMHNVGGNTGAGNAPSRREYTGKWANTSAQITQITVHQGNSSNTFDAGSYITVLAAKEEATADTITVSDLAAKKHLMVQVKGIGTGGTVNCNLTFNSDTGNNYAIRESVNGGSDSTNVSQANTDNLTGTVTGNVFATVHILNEASKEKLFISEGLESASGAGNAPERKELVGKWANTSNAITVIKANNGGTGSYAEGSEVTVYGTD